MATVKKPLKKAAKKIAKKTSAKTAAKNVAAQPDSADELEALEDDEAEFDAKPSKRGRRKKQLVEGDDLPPDDEEEAEAEAATLDTELLAAEVVKGVVKAMR